MIDISVNELVKSFEVGQTLLDGLSFDIYEGECVGIMGRNGCGKTTLFRLLTGELSPDSGEIHIAAGKKLGLISQIPVYPAGFSVEDVLRTAFAALASLKRRMEELEKTLEKDASRANLAAMSRTRKSTRSATALASRPKCAAGNSTVCPAAKRRA